VYKLDFTIFPYHNACMSNILSVKYSIVKSQFYGTQMCEQPNVRE